MHNEMFDRTSLLIGDRALGILKSKRVAVFGLGGVGGHVLEALVRGGIGELDLFDGDTVQASNLNRQIVATHKTIGRYKVDVAKERAEDINPKIKVRAHRLFYSAENSEAENASRVDLSVYDYIVDAIDTVTGKILLIERAEKAGVPIISSMGAGNKMDPTAFLVDDIYKTSVCPLAKIMRKELKSKGIKGLKVVYSKEMPINTFDITGESGEREYGQKSKRVTGSNSFVPPACGLVIASEVIKDLIEWKGNKNG